VQHARFRKIVLQSRRRSTRSSDMNANPTEPSAPPVAADPAPTAPAAPPKSLPKEIGGPSGPEPTRYGDWERKGRCSDF
jgi:hypothetical protein